MQPTGLTAFPVGFTHPTDCRAQYNARNFFKCANRSISPTSQRSFTNTLNRFNHQTLFENSFLMQSCPYCRFVRWVLGSLEEGVFDETLCSLDLCGIRCSPAPAVAHHWHKHHARAAYADIEPCGCDGVYTGSLDASPIPLSHVISSSPGLVPAAPAGSTPAAAGAAGLRHLRGPRFRTLPDPDWRARFRADQGRQPASSGCAPRPDGSPCGEVAALIS